MYPIQSITRSKLGVDSFFYKILHFLAHSNPQLRNSFSRLITYYTPAVNNITTKKKIQQNCFRIVVDAFHETLM